ncbi:MAG: nucleotidyltransferase domain-containing protein [Candidatus Margulisbacteria bacterium]|nr:nucleotidyltransferase domain-containing protein [Candidatus Margulisiibacteriota bacterium]
MLNQDEINKIIDTIKDRAKPSRIYLFGSYASGKATDLSDVDLLVVDDSPRNKNQLALEISKSLFPRNFGLDLIVASSEEIRNKQRKKLGFWLEITSKGKKVYEQS